MFEIRIHTGKLFIRAKENSSELQATDGVTKLGIQILRDASIPRDKNWFWIGAAALLGFTVLFNVLFTLALTYLNRELHSLH